MFSPAVRWLLVFASLGFGVHSLLAGRWTGIFFVTSGLLLAAGHFLYGSVRAAFVALRRGNLKRAHGLIHRTPTRWLTRESRAYYHWVRAALAEARGEVPDAIEELARAVALPLRSDRDRVLALGTLAALHAKAGERDAALERLDEAAELGPAPDVAALLVKIRSDLG